MQCAVEPAGYCTSCSGATHICNAEILGDDILEMPRKRLDAMPRLAIAQSARVALITIDDGR